MGHLKTDKRKNGSQESKAEMARSRKLAHACLKGDENAFAELYGLYRTRIYNLCQRIVGNRADAADTTQEVFVSFLNRLDQLDLDNLKVSSYLFAIARYESLDLIEKRRRTSLTADIPEFEGEKIELELDPERNALQDVQHSAVITASNRLPKRQRVALALCELEKLSYREIGEVLELNENAVAQLICRARLRLCQELREDSVVVPAEDDECERAVPLILLSIDGKNDKKEARWLDRHLRRCENCRVNLEAIEEACVSYRSLLPVPATIGFTEVANASSQVLDQYKISAGKAISLKAGIAKWTIRGALATSASVIAVSVISSGGLSPAGDPSFGGSSVEEVFAAHATTVSAQDRTDGKKARRGADRSSNEKSHDTQAPSSSEDNFTGSSTQPSKGSNRKGKKSRDATWRNSGGDASWTNSSKKKKKSRPTNGRGGGQAPGGQPKSGTPGTPAPKDSDPPAQTPKSGSSRECAVNDTPCLAQQSEEQ